MPHDLECQQEVAHAYAQEHEKEAHAVPLSASGEQACPMPWTASMRFRSLDDLKCQPEVAHAPMTWSASRMWRTPHAQHHQRRACTPYAQECQQEVAHAR
jgi:hypothetical protein